MTIKIKGHEDFIRDAYSGAVINTNKQEYIKYKERRRLAKEKEQQFESLSQKVERLEKLVHELTRQHKD
jgi:phosphopantetheine adenylyltransferase